MALDLGSGKRASSPTRLEDRQTTSKDRSTPKVAIHDEIGALVDALTPRVARARAIARLDQLFASGRAPNPIPEGFLIGRMLSLALWGPYDRTVRRVTELWMPWLGKSFRPAEGSGINLMRRDARLPIRVMWPSIRPQAVDESRVEAFPFRLHRAPGELDPAANVLKVDYDFEANPRFVIRRILDEVVEIGEGLYLGRILYRWRGRFHRIGFFTLERPAEADLGTIEERSSRSGGTR